MTDFWVFVCLVPSNRGVFRPQFVVVPTADLADRLGCYHPADPIHFYLTEHRLDGGRAVVDDRGIKREVSTLQPDDARVYTKFWSEARDIWRDLEEGTKVARDFCRIGSPRSPSPEGESAT